MSRTHQPGSGSLARVSDKLEVVAVAANEPEAALLCQRLAEAGIHAIAQRTIGGPEWGFSGSRYVYVDATDAERASNLLKAGE
jgi:hypothetical protein